VRANSYDFIRFLAVSAMLVAHHFLMAGKKLPFEGDLGGLAILVLFTLSGFLTCRSLLRDNDWAAYLSARVLRLIPNLTLALVVTSAAALVWFHNYDHLTEHLGYVLGNFGMFFDGRVIQHIPGVDHELNRSLWSLPYGAHLYVLLLVVFRMPYSRYLVVLLGLAFGIGWGLYDSSLYGILLMGFGSYFFAGAMLAAFWEEKYAVALGAVAAVALPFVPDFPNLQAIVLALAVAGLGSSHLMAWFSKGGDPSYGMYIFAWPVQQFSMRLIDSFWISMLVAFLTTTLIGYATWHGFEKRLMARRGWLARFRRGGVAYER
jgi:peptidoglycan/LPS O-acetylase OafA/YrhL